jgi:hypothetical protein
METSLTNITIDGFRFIENLQTTARQLIVCSEIIKQLNNKQLPQKVLEQLLVKWSSNEELKNIIYRNSKGKVTNGGKKTAALRYYFALSESLGLTKGFNNVYMNTNISYTLLYFLTSEQNDYSDLLQLYEKLFYCYQLLNIDADGIILLMGQLTDSDGKTQKTLQVEFKDALSQRLIVKGELASTNVKYIINNKFRAINYVWRSPEIYAEHIIAPRYEWLASLGLVCIKREKKFTYYSLSDKGWMFYKSIPNIGENGSFKDISERWLSNFFFTLMNNVFDSKERVRYNSLSEDIKDLELGKSLERAGKAVKSSISSRLPLLNTYLFICIDLFVNRNTVIDFSEIFEKLKVGFNYNAKSYSPKVTGRANESYITIALQK